MIADAASLEPARSVTVPTLVVGSAGSSGNRTGWAAALVEVLPDGTHRGMGGRWHGVPDHDLARVVTEFLRP